MRCGNDSLPLGQGVGNEVTDVSTNSVEYRAVALLVEVEVKNDGHLLHCYCPFLLVIGARVGILPVCGTTIGRSPRQSQALSQ